MSSQYVFYAMTRSYDMSTRSRGAWATRLRIIEAAHRLLGRPDGGSLSLQEVADEAGISRATIYNRVGTRRELLTAVFEDQGRLIGYNRVLAAMSLSDPSEAVAETVREGCRAWEVIPDAIRRTLALAALDEEIGELVAQFEAYRRSEIERLADRARPTTVADVWAENRSAGLSLITSFSAYDHLRSTHKPAEAMRVLTQLASATLNPLPITTG